MKNAREMWKMKKKKKKKVVCNRYAKGRRKNQKTVELKEAWQ